MTGPVDPTFILCTGWPGALGVSLGEESGWLLHAGCHLGGAQTIWFQLVLGRGGGGEWGADLISVPPSLAPIDSPLPGPSSLVPPISPSLVPLVRLTVSLSQRAWKPKD